MKFKLIESIYDNAPVIGKCCFCGKELTRFNSNNISPLKSKNGDKCCDECNFSIVLPSRVSFMKNKTAESNN